MTKPPNSSGRLPVGCLGHVTATPKDEFFNDVNARGCLEGNVPDPPPVTSGLPGL